ncbi:methylated-DNA--[protein]-cysteine S-methyltransferase [Planctobacterium marinum]|uniref:Methylated-DNA--protein-cysteine methyltransferase n=1 Tax=Planctobacterium marinum TaxID=1631968 RepID=A0AA48KUJ3_9ALTE|nr:methylated-DNA--protein-cysteine methyltransferase [Planctobacterium marinum]
METQKNTAFAYLQTPIGLLEIAAEQAHLKHILFVEDALQVASEARVLQEAKKQLSEYFEGNRRVFDLPLSPQGTAFQNKVWQALLTIDYGQTCSYVDIAETLGDKNAVRAVGAANGKNPLSIVVPCHRVIGKNGKLTGYAGGLSRKAWLLDLESGHNSPSQFELI